MPSNKSRHWRNVEFGALMEPWPKSWAGTHEDESIGRDLVAVLRPFMQHLQQKALSPKTLRRHLNNLWLIGGEIIRELHFDPALPEKHGFDLIREAIDNGQAPLVRDLTEAEQNALDATARKLLRFLSAHERLVETET